MNYSHDEFEALREAVEDQGGVLHDDRCLPRDVEYIDPPYTVPRKYPKLTQGCGHQTVFVTPYTYDLGSGEKANFIRACAVCDNIGGWPRFREAVRAASDE